jgi:hypothetical protein
LKEQGKIFSHVRSFNRKLSKRKVDEIIKTSKQTLECKLAHKPVLTSFQTLKFFVQHLCYRPKTKLNQTQAQKLSALTLILNSQYAKNEVLKTSSRQSHTRFNLRSLNLKHPKYILDMKIIYSEVHLDKTDMESISLKPTIKIDNKLHPS